MSKIDVMIAGAQKSGTSSVVDILRASDGLMIHDSEEFPHFIYGNTDKIDKEVQLLYGKEKVNLAKSACLYKSEESLKLLKAHNSDVKIVLFLREPTERAFSSYLYALQKGWEVRKCPNSAIFGSYQGSDGSVEKMNTDYLFAGYYAHHIKALLNIFDKSNVKVYLFEDFKVNPELIIKDLCNFIGVQFNFKITKSVSNKAALPNSQFLAKHLNKKTKLNQSFKALLPRSFRQGLRTKLLEFNKSSEKPPSLSEELRSSLEKYYEPKNVELERFLKLNLGKWK
ncbi:sulfotransferase domain-containing protein [Pseudoalteromonas distincta]|uniref:sulfotransferase domain-containing protein n=1 Tax=Pseudoalteromonas distincta TaxID=77608 RepID=UPI0011F34280|nr:sulfotransferase domain-containing protein [Pseudoalteromonas distincta]KAA1162951.1 sulfotransferase domain-containing protein [Pseudoalteromonas distincta]